MFEGRKNNKENEKRKLETGSEIRKKNCIYKKRATAFIQDN